MVVLNKTPLRLAPHSPHQVLSLALEIGLWRAGPRHLPMKGGASAGKAFCFDLLRKVGFRWVFKERRTSILYKCLLNMNKLGKVWQREVGKTSVAGRGNLGCSQLIQR